MKSTFWAVQLLQEKKRMQDTGKSCLEQQPEIFATNFNNSLQDLKNLSSQLHHAADYYQTTFLESERRGKVVENTKEYICNAVVIIVDHLGSISSKLENCLSESNTVPETQLRIDTLKQRLLMCQQYSNKLALANIYWSADFQRYYRRYTSSRTPESATVNQASRTTNGSPNAGLGSQVGESLSILPKAERTYFQFKAAPKAKRGMLNRKVLDNKEIKARIMRHRRRILM